METGEWKGKKLGIKFQLIPPGRLSHPGVARLPDNRAGGHGETAGKVNQSKRLETVVLVAIVNVLVVAAGFCNIVDSGCSPVSFSPYPPSHCVDNNPS